MCEDTAYYLPAIPKSCKIIRVTRYLLIIPLQIGEINIQYYKLVDASRNYDEAKPITIVSAVFWEAEHPFHIKTIFRRYCRRH